jgi:hypothetical protein
MIAKPPPAAPASPRRRRAAKAPLEVRLSLKVRFGEEPDESVVLMQDRRVPMVNSVFENRDRILRSFTLLLLRASMSQPKVMREVIPALRLFSKARSKA